MTKFFANFSSENAKKLFKFITKIFIKEFLSGILIVFLAVFTKFHRSKPIGFSLFNL